MAPITLSLKVALTVVVLTTAPSIGIGYLLARFDFPGKSVLEGIIHAPLVVPPVVTGYLLLLTLGRNGVPGRWLESMGVRLAFTWQGAALAAAIVSLPLAVRAVRTSIEMVDPRLEEAAAVLGYSPTRVFLRITLPLAWPGVLAGALLAFSRSLGEFGATITFAGNIEGITQTLPLAIYTQLQVPGGEKDALLLSSLSLGLCIVSLTASELLNRRAKRRVTRAQSHA